MPRFGYRPFNVKQLLILLAAALLFGGCATNTIDSRRRERATAFAGLSPEFQELVKQGQIKRGMPSDAVYIAWGKPSQIIHREDQQGAMSVWLYHGNWLEETRYWTYRSHFPVTDYNIRSYVSAEVTFVNDAVTMWQTLPRPAY